MPRVRLRAPCRAAEAVLPGCLAHLRIAEVAMNVRHLLGERIPGPDALRAAEVGDAGVGGDARPGERDDALRLAHPGADFGYDFRIHPGARGSPLRSGDLDLAAAGGAGDDDRRRRLATKFLQLLHGALDRFLRERAELLSRFLERAGADLEADRQRARRREHLRLADVEP